jgi:hypothetical protein
MQTAAKGVGSLASLGMTGVGARVRSDGKTEGEITTTLLLIRRYAGDEGQIYAERPDVCKQSFRLKNLGIVSPSVSKGSALLDSFARLRCPICASGDKSPSRLSTAALPRPPFFRRRRRSGSSPLRGSRADALLILTLRALS